MGTYKLQDPGQDTYLFCAYLNFIYWRGGGGVGVE